MDWKQELIKRLDALADKLGTTGQYLWTVLVKQAYVVGFTDFIWVGFYIGAAYALYKAGNYFRETADEEREGAFWVPAIISWIAVVGMVIGVFYNAIEGVQYLINPQYYALHEVLQTLGK